MASCVSQETVGLIQSSNSKEPTMYIEEALSKFLIQLEADGRAASTIAQYDRHVRLFAAWCAQVRHCGDLSEITHEDIARFLSSPQARTRANGGLKKATSVNSLRSSLKAFFGYLHEADYTAHNPGRLIRRAICASPPPRVLSEAETSRLLATLAAGTSKEDRRDHALFNLMLSTGIRLGSAIALDAEDVDLDAGQIHIRTTKGNRPERVFIGKAITKHLGTYLKDLPHGPLFQNAKGQRLSQRQVQRRFHMWSEKAGLPPSVSVHCTRHTFATRLYKKTGDVFLVKEALRHRSITSTLVYAEADQERLREAVMA